MSQQYFDSDPRAASRPQTVDLVLSDIHLRLATDAGVFSADRVDPGTRVLLETVPAPPPTGDLLDLGCGYGPIALTMATRAPGATIWAVDVNERALALCAHNAETAARTNVRTRLVDHLPEKVRFAAMWSNPPIRIGKPQLQQLLTTWLDRLSLDGVAHIVVHKNLGSDSLHRWLDDTGWPTSRLRSRSGYRVLRIAARPRPAGMP